VHQSTSHRPTSHRPTSHRYTSHRQTSDQRRRLSVGTGTAALSLGLCLCAGQLLSTSAAEAATPVKAAAVAKVQPKITESFSTRNLAWGSKVRITSKVINPKTGKVVTSGTVRLQAWRSGHWTTYKNAPVKRGYAVVYAAPTTSLYFRTEYLGNSSYTARVGSTALVRVRADGAKILAEAKKHKGALYKFAAAGPTRFDCSGFTEYVYRKAAGKSLPHKANSQQHYGSAVSKSSKRIGDLIIFRSGSYGYHAAIYAGNGYMYDSPHTGARVGKHKIYGSNYVVRRLVA
jgi:cell wall-associated NlpC family hydrolase